ncbi:hypothetical protein CHUAL_003341 [Chamberlinius hualienensis]
MGNLTTFVIIVATAVGIYLNWPPPSLSEQLIQWKEGGKTFNYQSKYEIFYRDDNGEGSTEDVLILIHGFPTSTYDWIKLWDQLKNRFGRLVAPDMLGFGFSDKPTGYHYTIFEQADIVEHLARHLNLKKIHLMAHDYGDTVAQELVHRYNENNKNGQEGIEIQTICLLNGGIFPETHIPKWSQEFLLTSNFKEIFTHLSNRWFFSRELASTFGEFTQPTREDLLDWWAQLRYKNGHRILPNLMQYIAQRRQNRDRWVTALQNTVVPLHFVYGPLDPINRHPAFVERYKILLPSATIDIIPKVGHYVQWEAAQETLSSYFNFLEKAQNK